MKTKKANQNSSLARDSRPPRVKRAPRATVVIEVLLLVFGVSLGSSSFAGEWSFSEDKGPSVEQYQKFEAKYPDECLSRETCEANMRAKEEDADHDGANEAGHCIGDRRRQGLDVIEAIKACRPEVLEEKKDPSRAPVGNGGGSAESDYQNDLG